MHMQKDVMQLFSKCIPDMDRKLIFTSIDLIETQFIMLSFPKTAIPPVEMLA